MLRRGATIAAALLAVLLAQRSAGQVAPRSALEDASATADSRQLDIGAGGFVTLTSVLPLPAQESIVVKDMKGTVVRTLVNESRPAGVYADKWDGKGDGGRRLKDDQYRWVATFTTGGHTFTIDRSNELDGDFELKSHQDYPSWDPFRGLPLRFSVTFERPGEIVLIFSRATFNVSPDCDRPEFFCRFLDGYFPAGEFTYEWAGVDNLGAFRPDIHGIAVISHHEDLARNAIVVHGGRPSVSRLSVTPARFEPALDSQEVRFSLHTFQDERASVEVSWMNQDSRSVLKSLLLSDANTSSLNVSWDGRAANGMRVAPGVYVLSVRATDALGQESKAEILTTIVY